MLAQTTVMELSRPSSASDDDDAAFCAWATEHYRTHCHDAAFWLGVADGPQSYGNPYGLTGHGYEAWRRGAEAVARWQERGK
jgi:hypothetical protein